MGHQATFFITPDDTRAVEAALRETGDFAILHSQFVVSERGSAYPTMLSRSDAC